jgi:hypothetical protein
MLDSSKMSDCSQYERLQQMVEQMLEVLQKAPGNRTMTRLVQISLDFTKIVNSVPPDHQEIELGSSPSGRAPQGPLATAYNQDDIENTASSEYCAPDVPFLNWESFMGPDWFRGDFTDANYRFNESTTDISLDATDY